MSLEERMKEVSRTVEWMSEAGVSMAANLKNLAARGYSEEVELVLTNIAILSKTQAQMIQSLMYFLKKEEEVRK